MILNDLARNNQIYIATGKTDMRKSIDGLAVLVQKNFQLDPFSQSLFLFCGNRSDRIKALFWEGDGFILIYKRIEKGKFQWPKNQDEVKRISEQELRWLLEGLNIDQPKAVKKVTVNAII